ncbi:MAG TPA: hypothetical protein VGH31_09695 [Acidimicrobiales bacterium]
MLLVDAANVIGSRPTGWWRDRPGAARTFVDQVGRAIALGQLTGPVTVVLEGKACAGVPAGLVDGVHVHHAPGSADDMLVALISKATDQVNLVTADRELRERAEGLGAGVVGPKWLIERLE